MTTLRFTPCPGCDGHDCDWVKGVCAYPGAGKPPAPSAPPPQASEVVEQILAALDQALNSLEYIDRAHPEITGTLQRVTALGMVREAIPKAKALSRQAPQPADMPSGEWPRGLLETASRVVLSYDFEFGLNGSKRCHPDDAARIANTVLELALPAAPTAQGKADIADHGDAK